MNAGQKENFMSQNIKVILFDLGGVLIRNHGFQRIKYWLSQDLSVVQFNEKWISSKTVREFEKGDLSPKIFSEHLIDEFQLYISPQEFIIEFSNFLLGFYRGSETLLSNLKEKYRLATLSNTNSIHWKILNESFHLSDYIQNHFPSHLTGLLKPDRNSYENVVDVLEVAPSEIMFFDDNKINVESANNLGIVSFQVNGIDGVRKILENIL